MAHATLRKSTGSDATTEAESSKSHGALKNHTVFRAFFEYLNKQTLKALNGREWRCPACKGGSMASASHKGMRLLMDHAKREKACNFKLHQKFSKALEEEMKRRVAASKAAEIVYGKWLGLEEEGDHQIVWPPMLLIHNTNFEVGQNQKVSGMGNKELLECFKEYKPIKAKYAYGPQGHRGISILIFEDTLSGYLEGEHLHKCFLKEKRGRDDWNRCGTIVLHSSGKRVLYGYMASKEDIENFNKSSSKAYVKVKYEVVSYQSKVLEPMKKMKEENEKISWLENKIVEDQQRTKSLEEKLNSLLSRFIVQQNEIKTLTKKFMEQDEECKKGIDSLEHFYKEKIDQLLEGAT